MIFQSCVFGPIWGVKNAEKQSKRRHGHETFSRHIGKAKRKHKRVQEAHIGVTRLAALQPKQIPAGHNVAEFSKD